MNPNDIPSYQRESLEKQLMRTITGTSHIGSTGNTDDEKSKALNDSISKLEQSQESAANIIETIDYCISLSSNINRFPQNFFYDSQIIFRIIQLIKKSEQNNNISVKLYHLLSILATSSENSMNSFLSKSKPLAFFHNGFISMDTNYYEITCTFFRKSFAYSSSRKVLISENFFIDTINRFKYLFEVIEHGRVDSVIIQLVQISCDLFFDMIKSFTVEDLSPGKSEIQNVILKLYELPITIKILDRITHLVLVIGSKFGYLDILDTDMWKRTISLLGSDKLVDGYQYALALLNNTLCSSSFNDLVGIIPFQNVVRIVNNNCYENIDIQINTFHCLLSFATIGDVGISYFLEVDTFSSIVNIIQSGNFQVRQLGSEVLWAFVKCGTLKQSEYLISHPISKEILLDALSDDDIETTQRILELMTIPFVETIISRQMQNDSYFSSFLIDLSQKNEEILDYQDADVNQLAQRLQNLLDSISV